MVSPYSPTLAISSTPDPEKAQAKRERAWLLDVQKRSRVARHALSQLARQSTNLDDDDLAARVLDWLRRWMVRDAEATLVFLFPEVLEGKSFTREDVFPTAVVTATLMIGAYEGQLVEVSPGMWDVVRQPVAEDAL